MRKGAVSEISHLWFPLLLQDLEGLNAGSGAQPVMDREPATRLTIMAKRACYRFYGTLYLPSTAAAARVLENHQPRTGRILAAAVDNFVSIIVDVDAQICRAKLQGHKSNVHSVCWDPSGEYLASVSDDLVRVWNISSGGKADCVHELNCTGNKFRTCVFHPTHPSLLVVGCYERGHSIL